ncbi:MAG TPA: HEAT repeat domain-containing protein [Nitrospiria bacterium]
MESPGQTTALINPNHLINTLIDLQVGIRKVSFYSSSHPIIPKLVKNLDCQFQNLLLEAESIAIGIARDELLHQGNLIAKNNPVIRELARMLNQLNLISVIFHKGVTEDVIFRFLKLVAECRSITLPEREEALKAFHEDTNLISLKHISFGQAVKETKNENPLNQDSDGRREGLWKGLIKNLSETGSLSPEEAPLLEEKEFHADSAKMANLIQMLCKKNKNESQTYERVIARFIQEQGKQHQLDKKSEAEVKKDIRTFMTNLPTEIRENIFRFCIENIHNNNTGLENLIEDMPPAQMGEVMNQIHLSNQKVSSPILGLLKKLTTLSEGNNQLKDQLTTKLEGHQDLMEELFTSHADREFYPKSYRALLDEELAMGSIEGKGDQPSDEDFLDETNNNRHLAFILLEMLEGPIRHEESYEKCVDYLNRLLKEGVGPSRQKILPETLHILLDQHRNGPETHRSLMQRQIKKFLNPELMSQILQTSSGPEDRKNDNLLSEILAIAGDEIIPTLLDLLEVEETLTVRKRLLQIITHCGKKVIPIVVKRLENEKWYVVRNMLVLLRELKAKEALPQMVGCMKNPFSNVKVAALQALGEVGRDTEYFFQGLAQSLKDEDYKVFMAGTSILLMSKHTRSMDMVMNYLKTTKWGGDSFGRKQAILKTIGKNGGGEWIPILQSFKQQLALRFWNWRRQRALRKELAKTLSDLNDRGVQTTR